MAQSAHSPQPHTHTTSLVFPSKILAVAIFVTRHNYVEKMAKTVGIDVHCINVASSVFKTFMSAGMMIVANFQVPKGTLPQYYTIPSFWRFLARKDYTYIQRKEIKNQSF